MAALWNPAVNSVTITCAVQRQVSGRNFEKITVRNGHLGADRGLFAKVGNESLSRRLDLNIGACVPSAYQC